MKGITKKLAAVAAIAIVSITVRGLAKFANAKKNLVTFDEFSNIKKPVNELEEDELTDLKKKLTVRQGKLIEIIKSKKQATMKELKDGFPSITTRTLRRDLSSLIDMGIVEKQGSTRSSVYVLK